MPLYETTRKAKDLELGNSFEIAGQTHEVIDVSDENDTHTRLILGIKDDQLQRTLIIIVPKHRYLNVNL